VESGASSCALVATLIGAHVSAEMLLGTTGFLLTQSDAQVSAAMIKFAPSSVAVVAFDICYRNKTVVTTKH